MGVLDNREHEMFIRLVAAGKPVGESYTKIYGNENKTTVPILASGVMARPEVKDRLTELMIAGAEKTKTALERIVQEIERLALVDVREIFTPDGAIKPPKDWSADLGAQISSMQVDEKTDIETGKTTRTYKVKFWDKNAALALLAKYRGMIVERSKVEVSGGITVDVRSINIDMTPETAAELYAMTIGMR